MGRPPHGAGGGVRGAGEEGGGAGAAPPPLELHGGAVGAAGQAARQGVEQVQVIPVLKVPGNGGTRVR